MHEVGQPRFSDAQLHPLVVSLQPWPSFFFLGVRVSQAASFSVRGPCIHSAYAQRHPDHFRASGHSS